MIVKYTYVQLLSWRVCILLGEKREKQFFTTLGGFISVCLCGSSSSEAANITGVFSKKRCETNMQDKFCSCKNVQQDNYLLLCNREERFQEAT